MAKCEDGNEPSGSIKYDQFLDLGSSSFLRRALLHGDSFCLCPWCLLDQPNRFFFVTRSAFCLSQVKCIMDHSVGRQARHFSRNRLSTIRT